MSDLSRAHFPMQGPIANPTIDDYVTELALLQETEAGWRSRGHSGPSWLRPTIDRWESVIQRLAWAPRHG